MIQDNPDCKENQEKGGDGADTKHEREPTIMATRSCHKRQRGAPLWQFLREASAPPHSPCCPFLAVVVSNRCLGIKLGSKSKKGYIFAAPIDVEILVPVTTSNAFNLAYKPCHLGLEYKMLELMGL